MNQALLKAAVAYPDFSPVRAAILCCNKKTRRGFFPAVILCAACCLALYSPLYAEEFLTPEQAAAHVGETKTVCGPVANTFYLCCFGGRPTFINFGKPYPEHVFSIAIMGESREKFDNCPEKMFAGKNLCVTGLIETYDDKPLIIVKEKEQIREVSPAE